MKSKRMCAALRAVLLPAALLATRGARAAESPLGAADWICPREIAAATNVTCAFRATFTAPADADGTLRIAADSFYAVELNGASVVEHARLPDVPPHRFYDTLPIAVRRGANELIVKLHVVGVDTFQTLPGDPGLAFALDAGETHLTSAAPLQWRPSVRDLSRDVPLMTWQFGHTYVYDARLADAPWRDIGAADRVRKTALMDLVPRPVPLPRTYPALQTHIVDQGVLDGSAASGGTRSVASASAASAAFGDQMDATPMHTRPADSFFSGGTRTGGTRSVASAAFASGFYIVVDLGREESGLLDIAFETDAGTVVDIGHGEHRASGRVKTALYNYRFVGRILAREGETSYVRWQRRMAGRYLQLHVRGARTRFVLHRATLRPVLLPRKERPAPAHLNERQQQIWNVAVRTLRLCMHEHYEDCPWREQALYANDARNQILCGYYAFEDDGAFAALSLELLARGMRPDGWLEMCMPARIAFTIPSFTFSWNLAVRDHWNLYRDRAFVAKMAPTMKTILDRRLGELKGDLLPSPADAATIWPFYDWAPGLDGPRLAAGKTRFDAPLNILLVLSLEADAPLLEMLGDRETARRWREAATRIRTQILATFWNAAACQLDTYRGDIDWTALRMKPGDGHELVQALALLADCIPADRVQDVALNLAASGGTRSGGTRSGGTRSVASASASAWIPTTLSQSLHKFAALEKAGPAFARRARTQMDEQWGAMLDSGATSFWEMKDGWRDFSGAGSLCHGWSAVPIYFYAR